MNATRPAGYSGTPLAKKLGYRDGNRVFLLAVPDNYRALVDPLPAGVLFEKSLGAKTDLVHGFFTDKAALGKLLKSARQTLPLGLVDIKVCAVDDTWSGLKLVMRREPR